MKTYVYTAVQLDQQQKEKITSEIKRLFGSTPLGKEKKIGSSNLLSKIDEKIKRVIGKDSEIVFEVNSDIIGGLVIKHGDQVVNLSMKTQLSVTRAYLSG